MERKIFFLKLAIGIEAFVIAYLVYELTIVTIIAHQCAGK